MDALKSAGRAIIKSPGIPRHTWGTSKHENKAQDKVFAYVAQSQYNETLECHAFLCPKKKTAQAVTLTVAQAFKVALDLWETAQEGGAVSYNIVIQHAPDYLYDVNIRGAEKTNGRSNEEQLRKPFFSSSVHQSTSQHNTPDRRPPVKQDSWVCTVLFQLAGVDLLCSTSVFADSLMLQISSSDEPHKGVGA
ncbi:UNVERIFIED_CONTAM: hypothetical protein FKN15_001672 [Acipenser sinensis]